MAQRTAPWRIFAAYRVNKRLETWLAHRWLSRCPVRMAVTYRLPDGLFLAVDTDLPENEGTILPPDFDGPQIGSRQT